MNEITNPINYDFNGHPVRVVGTYEEPWFVAQDICEHLGLENVSETVNGRADRPGSGLDDDESAMPEPTRSGRGWAGVAGLPVQWVSGKRGCT